MRIADLPPLHPVHGAVIVLESLFPVAGAPFFAARPEPLPFARHARAHHHRGLAAAYLVLVLADDEGKPTSPPKATQLGKDTRLKPFEERTLTYEIPAKGVALVRSEVYYSLLWPGLANQFKHLPEDLRSPVLIAEAESSVSGS